MLWPEAPRNISLYFLKERWFSLFANSLFAATFLTITTTYPVNNHVCDRLYIQQRVTVGLVYFCHDLPFHSLLLLCCSLMIMFRFPFWSSIGSYFSTKKYLVNNNETLLALFLSLCNCVVFFFSQFYWQKLKTGSTPWCQRWSHQARRALPSALWASWRLWCRPGFSSLPLPCRDTGRRTGESVHRGVSSSP